MNKVGPVVFAATLLLLAQAAFGFDISGSWLRGDGNIRVVIAPCGSKICVTNAWIRDQSDGEAVGDRLEMALEPQGPATLVGTAFDVKRNLNYSLRISIDNERMNSQGCVVRGVLCKTMSWTRDQR